MRPAFCAALAVALAGCDCGGTWTVDVPLDAAPDAPTDAGRDARTDAAPDAGPQPRDAGIDAPDAGPPGPFCPDLPDVLEVYSTEPCPPWEVAPEAIPRGLPEDPTPRVLWRFNLEEELSRPELREILDAVGFITHPAGFRGPISVGPDGHLYGVGPNQWSVMSISRDGTFRWARRLVMPDSADCLT